MRVQIPDAVAAVNAARLFLEQTEGRPGTAGAGEQGKVFQIRRIVWCGEAPPHETVAGWSELAKTAVAGGEDAHDALKKLHDDLVLNSEGWSGGSWAERGPGQKWKQIEPADVVDEREWPR